VSGGFFTTEKLKEEDLSIAVEVINDGFADVFQWLLGKSPPGRPEGERVRERFYRPNTAAVALRAHTGRVEGVCFLQGMGTRGVAGPLAIRPAYDTRIAGRALMTAAVLAGMKFGCKAIDSVTFPQSPTHLTMHFNFCEPLFPAPFLSKDLARLAASRANLGTGLDVVSLSAMDPATRENAILGTRAVTDRFTAGFDVTHDIRYVLDRNLGDTILVRDSERVLGFAICHYGERSEAFSDEQFLIKHLYVDPQAGQESENDRASRTSSAVFEHILHKVELAAAERGFENVALMASAGRRSMLRLLLDRGYTADEVHAHWAGRCPEPGQPIRSVGNDLASIRSDHFGASELR